LRRCQYKNEIIYDYDKLAGFTMFSERILAVRDAFFAGNNVKFANAIDAKEASVRSWTTGRAIPGGVFLAKICEICPVSPQWLLSGKGEMAVGSTAPPDLKIVGRANADLKDTKRLLRAVPILSDPVAAGDPRNIDESAIEDYAVIYDHWHGKEQRALRIKGDSMSPTLEEGDIVGVDVTPPRRLSGLKGYVVAARVGDGVVVKRLEFAGEYLILTSDNPRHSPIVLDKDVDTVIGAVIWAWHKF
jgi:phage repressor protein C with HTH and peptisase S24 domain